MSNPSSEYEDTDFQDDFDDDLDEFETEDYIVRPKLSANVVNV